MNRGKIILIPCIGIIGTVIFQITDLRQLKGKQADSDLWQICS